MWPNPTPAARPGPFRAHTRRMKRLRSKMPPMSWPAVAAMGVVYTFYVAKMVCALLVLLAAEWSSFGAVVTVGTIILVVAGLVAAVRRASRSAQPRTMADHLRPEDEDGTTAPF